MANEDMKIGQAYLLKQVLYVQLADAEQRNGARVRIGDFETPLEPAQDDADCQLKMPLHAEFQLRRNNESLPSFLLDGAPTGSSVEALQLEVRSLASTKEKLMQFNLPVVDFDYYFKVGPRISLGLQDFHDRAEVRMSVVSEGSAVEISVRFSSIETGQDHIIEIPVRQRVQGSAQIEDFQKIVAHCPFKGSCIASISVVVKSSDIARGQHGRCLIANAELVAHVISDESFQPIIGGGLVLSDGIWCKASLRMPIEGNGAAIKIITSDSERTLIDLPINRVHMLQNYGHGLQLRAAHSDDFVLAINAIPVARVRIDEESTFVPIPSEFLTGEPIELTLLDFSGSQVVFRMPLLGQHIITSADALREHSRAPYPVELTTRQAFRFKGLKASLSKREYEISLPSVRNALIALDAGMQALEMKDLAFPSVADPVVSVIIPVHNNVVTTYNCLCALLVAVNQASFEVIVVDDGSVDATDVLPTLVKGVTFIRNSVPQRFIRACNAGAKAARGKFIALLNNDTEPTVGWLDALLKAFETRPNAGLVGSKLLYPDGTLQDAGGIVWSSGNPWNYGNRDNPWHPKYGYTRECDYLSGAALLTSREIWDQVGGLSSYLEPMYFEDTDFAFKVREAGYKTYFVPSSVVYHYEGMTSGTNTSTGFKRYQEVNRPKFKKRWASAFARNGKEGAHPDLEKDRNISGRVLFVDSGVPREDRDAGSYAARREIELVQSLGYKVTFLPQNLAHLGVYSEELAETGVEVVYSPFYRSMRDFFAERGEEFDAVYMTRYHVAQSTLPLVREFCPNAKTILNNADLHFLRELRAAMSAGDPNRLTAMREVRDQELAVMRNVDLVLSYNKVEHVVISTHTDGQAKVMECPWVVTVPDEVLPLKGRRGMSFLGSFGHLPNREAAVWFCNDILPQLPKQCRELNLYGSGLDDEMRRLQSDDVHVVGFVEDVAQAYRHRVFVAPLLSGAGVKGKVLSALAHGIPTVLTPIAAEGMEIRNGVEAMIAETTEDWVHHIEKLMTDKKAWSAMSEAAVRFARERYSFALGREKMRAAFEALDLFGQF
jgi:GT2 family glycosyltransferase